MKKALFVLVFIMAVFVVNAQTGITTDTTKVTRESVKVADLQKAIADNIATDYVGFTIKEATKVTAKSIVTFEVVIVRETTTETLVYDKDGVFVKKLPPTLK